VPVPLILYVPGKNPKPPPQVHAELLQRCLAASVARADPVVAQAFAGQRVQFALAAWNHGYYGADRDWRPDQLRAIERLILDPDADAVDRSQATGLRSGLARWAYLAVDHFPLLVSAIPSRGMRSTIRETERYFANLADAGTEARSTVLRQLEPALASGRRVLVIAHSLGSVIAHDAVWQLLTEQELHLDRFLTLGSPLGLNFIQRRLQHPAAVVPTTLKGHIGIWVNATAFGDMTALDPTLADDFSVQVASGMVGEIRDLAPFFTAYRDRDGLNPHRSHGYLASRPVGAEVAAWLRDAGC